MENDSGSFVPSHNSTVPSRWPMASALPSSKNANIPTFRASKVAFFSLFDTSHNRIRPSPPAPSV